MFSKETKFSDDLFLKEEEFVHSYRIHISRIQNLTIFAQFL